jgi:hypothetical protein
MNVKNVIKTLNLNKENGNMNRNVIILNQKKMMKQK